MILVALITVFAYKTEQMMPNRRMKFKVEPEDDQFWPRMVGTQSVLGLVTLVFNMGALTHYSLKLVQLENASQILPLSFYYAAVHLGALAYFVLHFLFSAIFFKIFNLLGFALCPFAFFRMRKRINRL